MHQFYILSTGRVGSTYLARNLENYLGQDINLHQKKSSRLKSICANVDLAFKTKLSSLWSDFAQPESSVDPQQSIFIYNSLVAHFQPNAKIIVLVRDPRSFVTSMMNWKNRRLQSKISHHLIPFWSPVPFFHGLSFFKYIRMSKFEHFAWTWKFKNELFLSLETKGYRVLLVKMEDTVNNPETIKQIMNFTGIDAKEFSGLGRPKNESKKVFFPDWRDWSDENFELVSKHCKILMNQFGYR